MNPLTIEELRQRLQERKAQIERERTRLPRLRKRAIVSGKPGDAAKYAMAMLGDDEDDET